MVNCEKIFEYRAHLVSSWTLFSSTRFRSLDREKSNLEN
jgi:hypothetical protein